MRSGRRPFVGLADRHDRRGMDRERIEVGEVADLAEVTTTSGQPVAGLVAHPCPLRRERGPVPAARAGRGVVQGLGEDGAPQRALAGRVPVKQGLGPGMGEV